MIGWLYQFRGLPKRWVAILYNDVIAGSVGDVIVGAASLPIVVSAKQHGTGKEERRVKSDGK